MSERPSKTYLHVTHVLEIAIKLVGLPSEYFYEMRKNPTHQPSATFLSKTFDAMGQYVRSILDPGNVKIYPRYETQVSGSLLLGRQLLSPCTLCDVSIGGTKVSLPESFADQGKINGGLALGLQVGLVFLALDQRTEVNCVIVHLSTSRPLTLGLQFADRPDRLVSIRDWVTRLSESAPPLREFARGRGRAGSSDKSVQTGISDKFLTIRDVLRNLPNRVQVALVAGILVGICHSGVEFALAFTLQLVAGMVSGTSPMSGFTSKWFTHSFSIGQLSFLALAVALAKGIMPILAGAAAGAAIDGFKLESRASILRALYHNRNVNTGQLIPLFNENVNTSSNVLGSIRNVFTALASLVVTLGALMLIQPVLTLAIVLLLGFISFPTVWLSRQMRTRARAAAADWNKIHSRMMMGFRNLVLLRIYGIEDREEALAQQSLQDVHRSSIGARRIGDLTLAYTQFIGVLLVVLIAFVGKSFFAMSASLLPYLYLFFRFSQITSSVVNYFSEMGRDFPHLFKVHEWKLRNQGFLNEISASSSASGALPPNLESGGGVQIRTPIGITLDRVSFRYPGSVDSVIEKLSLRVEPGSTAVLLGPSGAGKSTVLSLMIGLLAPSAGQITVTMNKLTRNMSASKKELMDGIGYVGAESFLINGTVRENLTYGIYRKIEMDELKRVLEQAECQFVWSFSSGLEHRLNEQSEGLSAGQKQRICLARALLRRPRLLILDEATANLDVETEQRLLKTLQLLKGQFTIIATTHRPAFRQIADQEIELRSNPGSLQSKITISAPHGKLNAG